MHKFVEFAARRLFPGFTTPGPAATPFGRLPNSNIEPTMTRGISPPRASEAKATEIVLPEVFERPVVSGVVLFGMSPGNGHYNKTNVTAGVQELLALLPKGWTVRPCVPQGPSLWTYLALGYTKAHARRSARKRWKDLFRHARTAAAGNAHYHDCEWDDLSGGPAYPAYAAALREIETAYETNCAFRRDVQDTSRGALKSLGGAGEDAISVAARYLLEEFAGLTVVREVLGVDEVVLVYHKRYLPLERFIKGTPYGLPPLSNFSVAIINPANS